MPALFSPDETEAFAIKLAGAFFWRGGGRFEQSLRPLVRTKQLHSGPPQRVNSGVARRCCESHRTNLRKGSIYISCAGDWRKVLKLWVSKISGKLGKNEGTNMKFKPTCSLLSVFSLIRGSRLLQHPLLTAGCLLRNTCIIKLFSQRCLTTQSYAPSATVC